MRTAVLLALAGATATPIVGHVVLGPEGEAELFRRAEEIARREFSVQANMTVLGVEIVDQRLDVFGGRLRPDAGYDFHAVSVRLENTGKMDFAPSTWHFSAADERGSDIAVELGGAHDDFDASRLGRSHARAGVLHFEVARGSWLTEVRWQGELGESSAPVPPYAHR